MRTRRFVPLVAAAFLLVPALPASAHIEAFSVTGVSAREGAPREDYDFVPYDYETVYGLITCTAGEKYLVTAKVIDDSYRGKGRTKGTCTGESQEWVVQLTDESGVGDLCYERVSAKAQTKINGVPHDEERHTLPPNCP